MSGSLSGLASGLQGISQAFGGGVVLGGVRLQDFEVPEQVNFGGSQRLVTHVFPGGGRVVDVMGPDEADITWHGVMLGAGASERARQFDEMRVAGATITLLFGPFTRDVVISAFTADYRRNNWIGSYSITCHVIPPDDSDAEPGLLDGVLGDITSALGIDSSTLAGVGSALATAQSVAASVGNLFPGAAGVGAIASGLAGVGSALGAAQALANGNIGSAIGNIASVGGIGGSRAFGTLLSSVKTAATAASITAYVGRATANLAGST